MRIALINEVSPRDKNPLVYEALKATGNEIFNVGCTAEDGALTYIQTGLMAGIALNTGAADFVVGGCGTGQGFLMSAMQYPGVFCGLIQDSLDAWLFSQINGGNCISLALNKGFGWAGDINLKYIFEKLFLDPPGRGYPLHRAESQQASRELLKGISNSTHKSFDQIMKSVDQATLDTVMNHKPFKEFIDKYGKA